MRDGRVSKAWPDGTWASPSGFAPARLVLDHWLGRRPTGRLVARSQLRWLSIGLAALLAGGNLGNAAIANAATTLEPRVEVGTLGFNDHLISQFKIRMRANKDVDAAWLMNRAAADDVLARPTGQIDLDPRKFDRTVEPLILAWRMTGDVRYAQKIRDILLRLCQRTTWVTDAPLLQRTPVWHSDLGIGFYGQTFGRAYSSIRATLTPAERRTLVDGYIKGAVEPVMEDWIDSRTRIHALDTMGHNWWAHIVFGMGVGLVAILPDEARARDWLDRLNSASREWWSYGGSDIETKVATFDADGGYNESVNYADLAINSYLQFRLAWKQGIVQAPAVIPQLDKALGFFIDNAYPSSIESQSVDFGDGSLEANGAPSLAAAFALGDSRPDYLWYINLYNPVGKAADLHTLPHVLLTLPLPSEPGGQGETPKRPLDAWYSGIGWATLRTSWDKDAPMLAIRSGFTWNHSHADTGSFILFDQGKPLLIDSGNSSYAAPEYDAYYRQSIAHNVVTFNGKAEPEEDTYLGSQLPGRIPVVMGGGGIHYVFADATGPTSAQFSRNFRHVIWIDDIILIIDDVRAHDTGQFEWLVHPAGAAKRIGGVLHVENGEASVDVEPLFPQPFPVNGLPTDYPEDMRLVAKDGYADHDPKSRTTYYAFSPADKSQRMKFITALVPKRAQGTTSIERLEGKGVEGVRIRHDGTVTDVYLNLEADGSLRHRNANALLGGWDTDAYLLAVTHGEKDTDVSRLFIADGSYLRRDGAVLFDSLSKRFLIADFKDDAPRIWTLGQAGGEVRLRWPGAGAQLTVNGAPLEVERDGQMIRFECCATTFPK